MTHKSSTGSQNLSEQQFILALSAILKDKGWHTQLERRVGAWQPDLIAEGPSGDSFVVECKFTREDVNFSTIDYVLSASEALRSEDPSRSVWSVLVTATPAKGIVANVSHDSGLQIFQAGEGPQRVARWLVSIENKRTHTPTRTTYETGILSVGQLQAEIDQFWHELHTTNNLDAEIRAAGVNPKAFAFIEETPISVRSEASGVDPATTLISVVFSPDFGHVFMNVWDNVLLPRIQRRWGTNAIGSETG